MASDSLQMQVALLWLEAVLEKTPGASETIVFIRRQLLASDSVRKALVNAIAVIERDRAVLVDSSCLVDDNGGPGESTLSGDALNGVVK
jgi:hypothetical protein